MINIIIRQAKPKDLNQICEIANQIKINYNNPQKTGFLVYVLTPQEYRLRIKLSDFFYVAEENNQIIGFLMCYDNKNLQKLLKNGKLNHEDQLVKTIASKKEPYVFGDQIAIIPNKAQLGIGKLFMKNLFKDMKTENINSLYVGILHKPALNTASERFCEKQGFIMQEKITNSDKHTWGIYKLELRPLNKTKITNSLECMLASEEVLAENWLSKEDEKAWKEL